MRRFRAASPKLIEFKLSDFPTENGDGICRLHQDFKIRDLNSVLRFSQIRFPRSLPAQNCSASAKPKLIEFKLADFPTENGDGICRLHFLAEMERFELSRRYSRPTPLAGAPLRPLEYISKGVCGLDGQIFAPAQPTMNIIHYTHRFVKSFLSFLLSAVSKTFSVLRHRRKY